MKAWIAIDKKLPFHILSGQSCSVSIVKMSQRGHFSCDSLTKKRQFTSKRRNGLTMKSLRSYLVLLITSLHTVILQVVLSELLLLVFAYLYSEYSIKGRLRLRSKTSTLLHKPKLQEFHLPILQIKEGIRILTYISCV